MFEYLATLADNVDLAGRRVLDVGCGEGAIVRWLREQGANPVGVECNPEMRRRAIDADPDHADVYLDGVGQDLPVDDASVDVVIYSFSLHHVPIDEMPDALREARRVLRGGGVLYVNEPELDTPDNSIGYPWLLENDERTAAQVALDHVGEYGFVDLRRVDYDNVTVIAGFDVWLDRVNTIHPELDEVLAANRDVIEQQFIDVTEPVDGGRALCRRNLATIAHVPADESATSVSVSPRSTFDRR